jgi:cytochrome c2
VTTATLRPLLLAGALLGLLGCGDKTASRGSSTTTSGAATAGTASGSSPSAQATSRPNASTSSSAVARTRRWFDNEPAGDPTAGKQLVAKFECQRCHDGTGHAAIPNERHCVACHRDVIGGKFSHKPDNERWQKNVAHLTEVPSLADMGKRYRHGWLVRYLVDPYDLRPNLVPTMPRLPISREQARDIASYLTRDRDEAPAVTLAANDAAAGRKLLETKGCATCHAFERVAALPDATKIRPRSETRKALLLAPDLGHVRDMLPPAQLVRWLQNPRKVKPDTLMPDMSMTEAEAKQVAAYLVHSELGPAKAHAIPAALPLLKRKVRYAEVAEKVIDVTCRHCHGNPDVALGDGGPGHSGGFGFPPLKLDLSSYRDIASGYVDAKGERHSVFEKLDDGQPRIVAALWARHAELAGKPVDGLRGMPLGLPPLPAEQIQLIASWVAQGRPR